MTGQPALTNEARILACIRKHPDGIDDDELSIATGVQPRQQVHQITSRLARAGLIRRQSVSKEGKRRKIHNFPERRSATRPFRSATQGSPAPSTGWERRLAALVAATGCGEEEILDEALRRYARAVLERELD